jgi:hypothetical protein
MILKCIKRNGFVERPLELFLPSLSSSFKRTDGWLLLRLSGFARLTDLGFLGRNKTCLAKKQFLVAMYFCTATELPQHRRQYQKLPTRIIGSNFITRLIITKGLRTYDTYSRISLSVMIAPGEPSISLRSCLANNSKGRF